MLKLLRRLSVLRELEDFIHGVTRIYLARWFYISSIIGVVTGCLVWTLDTLSRFMLDHIVMPMLEVEEGLLRLSISPDLLLKLVAVLSIGHITSFLIVYFLCPEARGSGCDVAFYNYVTRHYIFRLRVPFLKVVATLPTLGLGASVGKEGPAVLIGASTSSLAVKLFRLDIRDLKVAYIAGISAGISAALNAPLGAVVFSIEFLRIHEIELEILEILYPALVASLISYLTVIVLSAGTVTPLITVQTRTSVVNILDPVVVLSFIVLGVLAGLFSRIFAELYYVLQRVLRRQSLAASLVTVMLVSFAIALIGCVSPMSITTGYRWLNKLLQMYTTCLQEDLREVIAELFIVILLKIVATCMTVSSGCSGGLIAPTIALGGYVGLFTFFLLKYLLNVPDDLLPLLVVGGAATLLGCAFRIPISAILIVAGMTETWPVAPLIALSMACAYLLTGHWSLYPKVKY